MYQSGTRAVARVDLGAAFMEFMFKQEMFIGTKCLPILGVGDQAGYFDAITRESIAQTPDAKRKESKYQRIGSETEDKSYTCKEWGLEGPLSDPKRKLYSKSFDAELVTVLGVANTLMLLQEIRIKEALFNTSTFTGARLYTDVSSAPWDTVGSDAIGHVRAAMAKVLKNTGLMPTTMVIGHDTLTNLKNNTAIKAAIQYIEKLTDANLIANMAALFGLREVIVGSSVYNNAKKGQTMDGAFVWQDDYALIAVVASDGNDLIQPSIGRTLLWTEDSPQNITTEQYREEQTRSDIFRVRHYVQEKIIDPYFGHLLKVDA